MNGRWKSLDEAVEYIENTTVTTSNSANEENTTKKLQYKEKLTLYRVNGIDSNEESSKIIKCKSHCELEDDVKGFHYQKCGGGRRVIKKQRK